MTEPIPTLIGTWQMLHAELSGERAPELVVTKTTVIIRASEYEVQFGGQLADRGTYETGDATELRSLVLHGHEGPNAGRTIRCIYQLRGDLLRVCYGLDGVAPTEFATAAGQQRYLATYRRTR